MLTALKATLALTLIVGLFNGCGPSGGSSKSAISQGSVGKLTVSISDKSLDPFRALLVAEAKREGFSPLPTVGTVDIETVNRANWTNQYPPPNYDIMITFVESDPHGGYLYSYRTFAFKADANGYRCI